MRVVHFARWFSGLSETFIYDSITELERQGLDNRVIALKRQNEQLRPFGKVESLNRPGRYSPKGFLDRVLSRLRPPHEESWIGFDGQLVRALKPHRPDIIHAHFGREASLVAPAATQLSVPLVVSFYGFDISRLPLDPWWVQRYQRLWHEAAAVMVLSRDMHQAVVRLGCPEQRMHIVHLARRMETPHPRSPRCPVRKFISVGRLVEKKGHADAITAIHHLASEYPDVRLDIIGEGPLKDELEKLITALKISDKIRLLGAVPSGETLARMEQADAFVLCSKTGVDGDMEGTPTVIVEAQQIGLPCISTRHAGIPEMLPQEAQPLLAPEGDVSEIAKRLAWLMNWPRADIEILTAAGRAFVQKHFDLYQETTKLRRVYETVLQSRIISS